MRHTPLSCIFLRLSSVLCHTSVTIMRLSDWSIATYVTIMQLSDSSVTPTSHKRNFDNSLWLARHILATLMIHSYWLFTLTLYERTALIGSSHHFLFECSFNWFVSLKVHSHSSVCSELHSVLPWSHKAHSDWTVILNIHSDWPVILKLIITGNSFSRLIFIGQSFSLLITYYLWLAGPLQGLFWLDYHYRHTQVAKFVSRFISSLYQGPFSLMNLLRFVLFDPTLLKITIVGRPFLLCSEWSLPLMSQSLHYDKSCDH